MPAVYPSRRLRILIGGQDWSAHYASLEGGRESLREGWIFVTATLVLTNSIAVPESLDPLSNPVRWRQGQSVYTQVWNDAGTAWIDAFFSHMIILREPPRPLSGQPLELELGCKLAYAQGSQFNNDRSGIIPGVSQRADLVAARLLEASGVSAADIALSAWPYELSRPFGKDSPSFSGQAAELAYSANWRYLYQTPSGQVVDRELLLNPGVAIATVTAGNNDILYEPLQEPQQPPEITKAVGVGQTATLTSGTTSSTESDIRNLGDVTPKASGIGTVSRVTTKKTVNLSPPTYRKTVDTYAVQAIVLPNPTQFISLILYTSETILETYEEGLQDVTKARLVRKTESFEQRGQSILPSDRFSNMRDLFDRTEEFEYSATEPLSRFTSEEKRAEIDLDSQSFDPWRLRTTETEEFEWTEYAPGRFDRKDKVGKALILTDRSLDRSFQDPWGIGTTVTDYDRESDNRPPATQFFSERCLVEGETHYEGTAAYSPPGGPSGRNREGLVRVPFGWSNDQMTAIAEKERDLTEGRYRGYEISFPVSDALLQSAPLAPVSVVVGTDSFTYLADALTFSFSQDRSEFWTAGIWVSGGYQRVANLAAEIPVGQFKFAVVQSSVAFAAEIPVGQFEFAVGATANLAAEIPVGRFDFDVGAPTALSWRSLTLEQSRAVTLDQWREMTL